jgi:Nif-specific regulatory protein
VGGNRAIKVDIRIITATNKDLAAMSDDGRFREDLFYRLNVFPIIIPPLRERGSDVITLADHFVARFAKDNNKEIKRITTPALDMLMSYHWPGNVRELENVIERAAILADEPVIHAFNLPPSLQTAKASGTSNKVGLEAKLDAVAHEMIVDALKTNQGNMTHTARELGITRHVLRLRMDKLDIDYRKYRP